MKAYKATYDYKCRDQLYEVGATYTASDFKICKYGIHFCKEMKDVFTYYVPHHTLKILEIEVLGDTEYEFDKGCTNKIKVLREVPISEWVIPRKYTLDERGNVLTSTDPNGDVYTHTYDDNNNMLTSTYPNGDVYSYTHDDNNNMLTKTNLYGVYTYTYDDNNNMLTSTYPNGGVYSYTYDENNNMLTQTDSDGDVFTYTYTYDENNNMLTKTDPNGDVYSYTYDENNRILSITYPDGNTFETHPDPFITITKS